MILNNMVIYFYKQQKILNFKCICIMKKKLIVLFLIFFSAKENMIGQIITVKDERIDKMVMQKAQKEIMGYRIQICFDSEKKTVDSARTKFSSQFPKIDTYIKFEAPNFNLKVGDFRTLIEAEKIKEKIMGEFTITIIHREYINLPRVD